MSYDTHRYGIEFHGGRERQSNAQYDESAPDNDDGRGGHASWFNPDEADNTAVERADARDSSWRWLYQLHQDRHDRDGNRVRTTAMKRDARTWASQLDVPDEDKERICHVLDRANGREWGNFPAEAAVLAAITLVVNERRSRYKPDGAGNRDTVVSLQSEDRYVDLRDEVGVTSSQVRAVRTKLRPLL